MKTYTKAEITSLEILEEDLRARAKTCCGYAKQHVQEGNFAGMDHHQGLSEAFEQTANYVKHLRENYPPAAGPWRTDEPPRDRPILAMWYHPKECCVIEWDFHQEEFIECGMDTYVTEPTKWAEINLKGTEHGTQNTSVE